MLSFDLAIQLWIQIPLCLYILICFCQRKCWTCATLIFQLCNLYFCYFLMHNFFSKCMYINITVWFVVVILIPICHPCDDRKDVKYVDSCPKNIDEWNAAAKKKNCAKWNNDCPFTEAETLVYHCVKDRYQPKLLEVCSKVWKSPGMI